MERALDKRERSKLGAHYTPRAYVERLVVPTIIEPLREEWRTVQAVAESDREAGRDERALRRVSDFHHRLCTTRILDPACGTGNFLYVSLELMKRLEGEVLDVMEALGRSEGLSIGSETVEPSQFYGLEINPRAAAIADLVLWIGYLKWQLRTVDPRYLQEPVLHAYGTIRHQDAILTHDGEELLRGADGAPLSRWDGVTRKRHPITGEDVPDPDATVPLYTYRNPRAAEWPAAEFIVGNPPFIGGKDMRAELGDGYAEAVWKARPHLPGGADFVMHFWDQAATYLREGFKPRQGSKAPTTFPHRFGFITTNSITQTFSRRVIERHLSAKQPLSLVFAVADHPWMKAADKAAVRIAMTVAEKGEHEGVLAEVVGEAGLNTDTPQVTLAEREGKITGKFTIGADLSLANGLQANDIISSRGVALHGAGFIVTPTEATSLGLGRAPGVENHILDYRHGRDIAQRPRGVKVIDLYPLKEEEVRERFPPIFQHVLTKVKPERGSNREAFRREYWWWFGRRHSDLREFLAELPRYVTTVETSRHRFFQFLDASIRPDNKLVNIGVDRAETIAALSSRAHISWALAAGGFLGVGNDPVYVKTRTFDPFPFPGCVAEVPPALRGPEDAGNAARRAHLAELGERLDAFRKQRLAEHDFLTMTGLYNVLERVRALEWVGRAGQGAHSSPLGGEGGSRSEPGEGQGGGKTPHPAPAAPPSPRRGEEPGATAEPAAVPPLSEAERAIYDAGLIAVLKEIHDDIDRAVFAAYGWEDLGDRLVGRPGATMPSPFKSEDQEAAEEELLSRLVALNLERQAEEKRGYVRWLRPDYQIPKLGHKVAEPAAATQIEAEIAVVAAGVKPPALPADAFEQIRLVRDALARAPEPVLPNQLAAAFAGKVTKKKLANVEEVLRNLAELGLARTGIGEDGATRYFAPRG
ncbi:DNA methyltransferase [Aurantimonas sp. C2-5-R2]|uniref:class I SAM-dependent DNA methyltransferase n=1 Tax=unclassified Aurantimonas TaxID=2638230 RepID=UPI002E18D4F5|nr:MULTISPECIES: DNA methyltransferase [unclassified Aurantimonas]MEC5290495.1 DNA methyltransferase [Aurantimonas sp. C2-3-R2]MEC5411542.1 DNA methyltransferase [Aurantimonas sp. C2-4-R8]